MRRWCRWKAANNLDLIEEADQERRLPPLDFLDFIGLGATGGDDLDIGALGLADERTRERRRDRNLALLGVGFGLADNLPNLLLRRILVDHGYSRAEFDGVAGQLRHVDHLGAGELVLELADAALVMRLQLLGGVIFGVF